MFQVMYLFLVIVPCVYAKYRRGNSRRTQYTFTLPKPCIKNRRIPYVLRRSISSAIYWLIMRHEKTGPVEPRSPKPSMQ